MKQVNIHEAKTHLSRLVEAAARGESFVIAKAGKPMVKVVPVEAAENRPKSKLGFMRGLVDMETVQIPEDFDTFMQDEIIAMFEESSRNLDRQLAGDPDAIAADGDEEASRSGEAEASLTKRSPDRGA